MLTTIHNIDFHLHTHTHAHFIEEEKNHYKNQKELKMKRSYGRGARVNAIQIIYIFSVANKIQ